MTAAEVAAFVITRWRLEHSIESIMIACIVCNTPIRLKSQVLAIVKAYIDDTTENHTYQRFERH